MLYYTILIKHISLYLLFLFNIKFSLQSELFSVKKIVMLVFSLKIKIEKHSKEKIEKHSFIKNCKKSDYVNF